jgi:hypothetical protein
MQKYLRDSYVNDLGEKHIYLRYKPLTQTDETGPKQTKKGK